MAKEGPYDYLLGRAQKKVLEAIIEILGRQDKFYTADIQKMTGLVHQTVIPALDKMQNFDIIGWRLDRGGNPHSQGGPPRRYYFYKPGGEKLAKDLLKWNK